jgi:hypothetical protein
MNGHLGLWSCRKVVECYVRLISPIPPLKPAAGSEDFLCQEHHSLMPRRHWYQSSRSPKHSSADCIYVDAIIHNKTTTAAASPRRQTLLPPFEPNRSQSSFSTPLLAKTCHFVCGTAISIPQEMHHVHVKSADPLPPIPKAPFRGGSADLRWKWWRRWRMACNPSGPADELLVLGDEFMWACYLLWAGCLKREGGAAGFLLEWWDLYTEHKLLLVHTFSDIWEYYLVLIGYLFY